MLHMAMKYTMQCGRNGKYNRNSRKGENMKVIRQLNYIFSRSQKIKMIILAFAILIGACIEVVGVAAIMPLVGIVTTPSLIHDNRFYNKLYVTFGFSSDRQFILFFIGVLIAIYILKNTYLILLSDLQNKFSLNNQRNIALKLMDCYMHQTYLFHLSKNVSELQRNVQGDVVMLFGAVLSSAQLFSELMTCLFIGVYLVILDKSISFGVIIILAIFATVFLKVTKERSLEYGNLVRGYNGDLGKWVRQSFEGIKDIKVANREDLYVEHVDKIYEDQAIVGRKKNIIAAMPRPLFEAVCICTLLVVVGIKIFKGVEFQYFIPVLSAFAIAAFRLLPSFGRLTAFINDIIYYSPAVENVYNDIREVEELQKEHVNRFIDKSEISLEKYILVDNISFSYPTENKPILKNASVRIDKNKSVAFIGPSGSGKTTLADIILGLLEPQEGHVYADNIDINDKPYGWHKLLGYIPQTIYLTDDTIRENVLFGMPADEKSDEGVWRALEYAQLAEFVRGLEKGIDTVIGERGVRLSGGQRQRIGIARALYSEPEVLVLDEATSALDTGTETAVMEAIDGLRGSRTMIIIAHRLTTIRNCDEVYEIKNGNITKRNIEEVLAEEMTETEA